MYLKQIFYLCKLLSKVNCNVLIIYVNETHKQNMYNPEQNTYNLTFIKESYIGIDFTLL